MACSIAYAIDFRLSHAIKPQILKSLCIIIKAHTPLALFHVLQAHTMIFTQLIIVA